MTNSQLHPKPASIKQRRYVQSLMLAVGESGDLPKTSAEANAEINRLKARKRLSPAELRREAFEARCEAGERHGDAAAFRPDEISGYGSSATWRVGQGDDAP
jgi:hypothetical protein